MPANTSLRRFAWLALGLVLLSVVLVAAISYALLEASTYAVRKQETEILAGTIAARIVPRIAGAAPAEPLSPHDPDPQKFQRTLAQLRPAGTYLGVREISGDQSVTLAFAGEPPRPGGLTTTHAIAGTPWELVLWRPVEGNGLGPREKAIFAVVLLAAVLIPVLGTVYVHRAIWRAVDHDLRSVARIFQDMRDGNMRVDYPMELAESRAIFNYLRRTGQKLVREHQQIRDLSLFDHLSQLHNRRAFETKLAELFERSRMAGPSSVLIIDLDHFKQVNDHHGHDTGDALIAEFSGILRALVRATDFVARLGGDEFCVIFPHTPLDHAVARTRRLRQELPGTLAITPAYSHPLRWTAGLAEMLGSDGRFDQVLWRADQALLRAKDLGRNRTCCHIAGGISEI